MTPEEVFKPIGAGQEYPREARAALANYHNLLEAGSALGYSNPHLYEKVHELWSDEAVEKSYAKHKAEIDALLAGNTFRRSGPTRLLRSAVHLLAHKTVRRRY